MTDADLVQALHDEIARLRGALRDIAGWTGTDRDDVDAAPDIVAIATRSVVTLVQEFVAILRREAGGI